MKTTSKDKLVSAFGAVFYQTHWEVIGEKVCTTVLEFLNGGTLSLSINSTFIAHIPKVQHPTSFNKFKPISLCNVLYKIIAKTLTNRLKKVFLSIISLNQIAFIPGRLITDNIIVAYETLHSMKTRKNGKVGNMTLQIDISKAYDRV